MMEAMPACQSRLMLRSSILLGLAFASCAQPQAADTPAPPAPAPQATPSAPELLWPDGNPGGWQAEQAETQSMGGDGVLRIAHVEQPSLQYYAPAPGVPPQPVAVIICPGGGYRILAMNKEGTDIAELLATHGFHAFVLKYRLPNQGELRYRPGLEDTLQAAQRVRARQDELGIKAVGILGFSAGGHLAAVTAAQPPRPVDFVSLVYPAYFLPDRSSSQLVEEVAPADAPVPAFLVHALNDRIPARNSVVYAEAVAAQGVAAEVHLYARGGHGFGLTQRGKLPVGDWPQLWMEWLRRRAPQPAAAQD